MYSMRVTKVQFAAKYRWPIGKACRDVCALVNDGKIISAEAGFGALTVQPTGTRKAIGYLPFTEVVNLLGGKDLETVKTGSHEVLINLHLTEMFAIDYLCE